jgi:4-amino-4-deoxy-L-arabinose transferase-like glycosyltransferase
MNVAVHHVLIGAAGVAVAVALGGLVIEAALARQMRGRWHAQPSTLIMCGAALAAFVALVYYNSSLPQAQGRYLFTAIGPLAILAMVGWRRAVGLVSGRLIEPLPAVVLMLAVFVNVYCLVRVIIPVYGDAAAQAWHLR